MSDPQAERAVRIGWAASRALADLDRKMRGTVRPLADPSLFPLPNPRRTPPPPNWQLPRPTQAELARLAYRPSPSEMALARSLLNRPSLDETNPPLNPET